MTAAAVNLVMSARDDPAIRSATLARDARGSRRAAARVGAARARPSRGDVAYTDPT